MSARFLLAAAIIASVAGQSWGQVTPASGYSSDSAWRAAGENAMPASPIILDRPSSEVPPPPPERPRHHHDHIARVTPGSGSLPNKRGQIWREYDISPYTSRVTTTKRPEQAMVDWILRETGYEAWHSEPLAILSATPHTLRVYHTPEMQDLVADIVDRFVSSEAENQTFSLRVITVESPNWRARAARVLRPVCVQTPGVNAWILQREDAAVLLAELQHRGDFRDYSSTHLLVNNGQSTAISSMRPRSYVRDLLLRPEAYPGFQNQPGQIDEGFSLEFTPLMSLDRRVIDATVKCNIDQVDRLVPVIMEIPTLAAPRQRTKLEVPQMTNFRFHERFRWPVDQVLLIGMGMVAPPLPADNTSLAAALPLLAPPRADLLVLIESRPHVHGGPHGDHGPDREARTYRDRY